MQIHIIHRAYFLITAIVVLTGMWTAQGLRNDMDLGKWERIENISLRIGETI